jgi:arabinoxylan arabinofuranohydrolase
MNKNRWILGLSLLLAVFLVFSGNLNAQNPIFTGHADPHMKVWNGKIYMSIGTDLSPKLEGFHNPYWLIISSTDMINWTVEDTINPKTTFMGEGNDKCWATDISTKNGKYYFYFSNGSMETGVLVADKPNGPYIDVLTKPLIDKGYSTNLEYDPTVIADDDGQQYIIFGRDGKLGKEIVHYQIAKLGKDLISLSEKSKDLISSQQYGFERYRITPKHDTIRYAEDKNYFHKHNDLYYLSSGCVYETSKNIYGPYSNRRNTGSYNFGHSSYGDYNGQSYHFYDSRCDSFNIGTYRQISITYLHYKDNGDMVDDPKFIDNNGEFSKDLNIEIPRGVYYSTGVGNYDATWDKIEAEWFFKKSGALIKKECPEGGFEIQNIQNNDYLNFPNIKNMKPQATINFRISSANIKGGVIEIHQDSEAGKILGQCKVPNTGSLSTYKTISSKLKNNSEMANLYFVFKGGEGEMMRLDWFDFQIK